MRNRFDLIDDRFVDLWIRMPDADCQNAAKTIQILVALVIPDVKAFAFYQGERFLVIGRDCRKKKLFVLANCFGLISL